MTGSWVGHDIRDAIVDFVREWSSKTELPARRLLSWLGLPTSKYHHWRQRYGKANEHNSWIPRDSWLEEWERQAILDYYKEHRDEGYRRLTYMMLDADVVAASPSSVYRVLKKAGVLHDTTRKLSKKKTGFKQPSEPHRHWHVDITSISICGTRYHLCSVLDGYSRYVVAWDIRPSMMEDEVEIILQRAKEKFPGVRPRIISDNGPQFIAKDFIEFIRLSGMTHVKTSVNYPQSNGKKERFFRSLKSECIRKKTPLSLENAHEVVAEYIRHYNEVRLHSAIGYIAPKDMLEGRASIIHKARDEKLKNARERRKANRQQARTIQTPGETEAGSAEEQPAKG